MTPERINQIMEAANSCKDSLTFEQVMRGAIKEALSEQKAEIADWLEGQDKFKYAYCRAAKQLRGND